MEKEKGINVCSLFDGIATTYLALEQLGIKINNYFTSEICKNAIRVSKYHFGDKITQLGDVRNVNGNDLPNIDLLVAGFPCVDLSSMRKDRLNLEGEKSGLFFEALRIHEEIREKNPNCVFLYENVGSMCKHAKKRIDDLLGVTGIPINSNLVSAQNRHRIYWTNIPNITLPENRNIKLQDIIESGYVDREKSNCVLTKGVPLTWQGVNRYLTKSIGCIIYNEKEYTEYSKAGKLFVIDALRDADIKQEFRLPTVTELERLQTLPDGYVGEVLKKTASHHVIGKGFTLEIIKHILSFAQF